MAAKQKTKEAIERKKRLAYTLYVINKFDQKVISQITGISERSISAWKNAGNWETDREEANMGFEPERKRVRKQFNLLLSVIESREEPGNVATSGEADRLNKLADAAKKLQIELSFAHKAESGKQFIQYVQQVHGTAKAVEAVELWHEYLMATA